jgi:hypothetical protein
MIGKEIKFTFDCQPWSINTMWIVFLGEWIELNSWSDSEGTSVDTTKEEAKEKHKTYSSRDSHVVTHRSTNLPFNCLCMAERTGCPVFS